MNEIQALEKARSVLFQKYIRMQPDDPEKIKLIEAEFALKRIVKERVKDEVVEYLESTFDIGRIEYIEWVSNTVSPSTYFNVKYKEFMGEAPEFCYKGDASDSTVFDVLAGKYKGSEISVYSRTTD